MATLKRLTYFHIRNHFLDLFFSAKGSSTARSIESNDETIKTYYIYDDNGYLPIHRAAFNGHEGTIKNILDDVQKRNELPLQLEAKTDKTELTPLLLATAVGRLEIIACLLKYPVNLNAVDVNGHGKKKKYGMIDRIKCYFFQFRYSCHCCSIAK
jgi:ankyrin repeat protein